MHMPLKFAWSVDVGSACVDISRTPKTDVLVIDIDQCQFSWCLSFHSGNNNRRQAWFMTWK